MSKKKFKVYPWGAMDMNISTFWDYFNQLKEYAINMFEWKNVPDTIDVRYLELTLFNLGYACYFRDDVLGDLALQCTLGGRFNVYNIPTQYHIVTANGFQAHRTKKDAVIIYNNYLHQPTVRTIMLFAYRLYTVQRTIDINTKQLRHPTVALVPENQLLSFKNLYSEIDANEEFVLGIDDMNLNEFQALNMGVKNETIDLNALKHQYMNEALTFLGINNANSDKKERLITSEVESNNEQILSARNAMLNARKEACKQINKMFGTNIDVEFRVREQQLDYRKEEEQLGLEMNDNDNPNNIKQIMPPKGDEE